VYVFTVLVECIDGESRCFASYDVAASSRLEAEEIVRGQVPMDGLQLIGVEEVSKKALLRRWGSPRILKVYGRAYFDATSEQDS